MKEGMRPTSMALVICALIALAFAGCGKTLGQLIYNDSLLCGDATQACAPDGGHFDLHIVDRTTLQVQNRRLAQGRHVHRIARVRHSSRV